MIWPKSLSNIAYVDADAVDLIDFDVPVGMEFVITQIQLYKDGSVDYTNMPEVLISVDGEEQDVNLSLLLLTGLASNLKYTARKNFKITVYAPGLTVGVYVEGYLQEVKKNAA